MLIFIHFSLAKVPAYNLLCPPVSAVVDGLALRPVVAGDDLVEGPHVDEVKQLGEELDGQGGVDPALAEQGHG